MIEQTISASDLRVGDKLFNDTAKSPAFEWLRVTNVAANVGEVRIHTTCYEVCKALTDQIRIKRSKTVA